MFATIKKLTPYPSLEKRGETCKYLSMRRLIKQTARLLRLNSTPAENKLWELIRNRKLAGKKFTRQRPIIFDYHEKERFFVADFYCHDSKLIIELDGEIHDQQKDYDTLRDYIINDLGISVLRISNQKIINTPKTTIQKIINYL